MDVLGMISQSIAPGSWFAAIPNSVIFWCMSVDQPVVKKSTICVVVPIELLKLTMLLILLFFKLSPLLINL